MKTYAAMRFGLLGEKLGHSFSVPIHNLLAGYEYRLYPMPPEAVRGWVLNSGLDGFNVTIPYKETVYGLCGSLSERAKRIGAVNTVKVLPDGSLYGDNTDYYGFCYLLSELGVKVNGKKTLVLGSGGASKTVRAVLEDKGAEVVVISRKGENNYGNLSLHTDAALIVNTTPVGMYPDNGVSPLDPALFPALEGVADLIYNPSETLLLQKASKADIPCINGLPMLTAQAKAAFEVFTGDTCPDTVIDRITREVSARTKNIVLVGMPGCGKTVCGRLAAEKLGRPFADTDRLIEETEGCSPAELILSRGEAAFRQCESEALRKLCKASGSVIATGGGAVTVPGNRDIMRQNGVVIFIDRNISLLHSEGRPLSVNLPSLYEKRLPLYKEFADVTVNGDGTPEETAEKVINAWRELK